MSVRLASQHCPLAESDVRLLTNGITSWHDHVSFPDSSVAEVKALFRRVFCLPGETVLVGSAVPDAIVLSDGGANAHFYALVMPDLPHDTAWECMELESDSFISFSSHLSFRDLLFMLSTSSHGPLIYVSKRWSTRENGEDVPG